MATDMKHSPGPWVAEPYEFEAVFESGEGHTGKTTGKGWRVESVPLSTPGNAYNVAHVARGEGQPTQANAALIASAPTLLAQRDALLLAAEAVLQWDKVEQFGTAELLARVKDVEALRAAVQAAKGGAE